MSGRLRLPPKRTYWLGCVVSSLEPGLSKASGQPYLRVRFENCPFIYILGGYMAQQYRLAMMERGLGGDLLAVGDVVHLDVRWRDGGMMGKLSNPKWIFYPHVDVDFGALMDDRVRIQKLIREGRA